MQGCRTFLLASLLLGNLPLTGFAQTQLVRVPLPSAQVLARLLIASPHDFVELCTNVKAGRAVTWQFESEAPVGFNTHFHSEGTIRYPESMTSVTAAKGRLVPGTDQDYCWMWSNSTALPVTVRVQLGP